LSQVGILLCSGWRVILRSQYQKVEEISSKLHGTVPVPVQ
jgi:hypothetical protein